MKLSELLLLIDKIAQQEGLSTPFVVGGLPRDKVLGKAEKFNDIDITTGNPDIHFLAKELEIKLSKFGAKHIILDDGHSRIMLGNLKLDFSSNFIIPNVERIVEKDLSQLQQESYSRDFTCNTLLMTMNLKKIIDITGKAIPDMQDKMIRTVLDPEITLGHDPKRILRVIYLSTKLQFAIDDDIITFIQNNGNLVSSLDPKYVTKSLLKSIKISKEQTLNLIKELNLIKYLPLTLSANNG